MMTYTAINLSYFKKRNVAVIGDVMVDRYLNGSTERISPEAPIPVINIKEIRNVPGGAANVMNNIAHLGAAVWGFGVVGDDIDAEVLRRKLKEKKINIDNIISESGRPTTLKCRLMVGHHQISRYDIETDQAVSKYTENKIISRLSKVAGLMDMFVISDYDKGMLTSSLIASIIEIARNHNILVLVDPKVNNTKQYVGVDYIKLNLHNAERVTGESGSNDEGIRKICHSLATELDCRNVILTMGKDGLCILSKNEFYTIPTMAKDVYDVTGAGDVMTSVLAVALSNGYDIRTSCVLGTIASAIKVAKIGTYSVSFKELKEAVTMYNGNK